MEPDRGLVAISGMTTVPEVQPPPTGGRGDPQYADIVARADIP
jgi:hypothetical protein